MSKVIEHLLHAYRPFLQIICVKYLFKSIVHLKIIFFAFLLLHFKSSLFLYRSPMSGTWVVDIILSYFFCVWHEVWVEPVVPELDWTVLGICSTSGLPIM